MTPPSPTTMHSSGKEAGFSNGQLIALSGLPPLTETVDHVAPPSAVLMAWPLKSTAMHVAVSKQPMPVIRSVTPEFCPDQVLPRSVVTSITPSAPAA